MKPLKMVNANSVAHADLFGVLADLIRIRNQRGISQTVMAGRMGVPQSVLSRLETSCMRDGGRPPTLALVQKYASALGREVALVVL